MELKLYQDIKAAQRSGRDTAAAENSRGDGELKEGRTEAAKRHYSEAEGHWAPPILNLFSLH
jgi:hypothetical protein